MAAAEERQAFAKQLAEMRALDIEGKYKKNLDELELEYQFILLRSLDRFHNEMKGAHMLARLDTIREELCNTVENNTYPPNRVLTGFNMNLKICRYCNMATLKPILFAHELCCEKCGSLNHWMASHLTITNSITMGVITRLSNADEPTDHTTSGTTLKNT